MTILESLMETDPILALNAVLTAAADHLGTTMLELRARDRNAGLCYARSRAWFAGREILGASLGDLGAAMDRTHGSVASGIAAWTGWEHKPAAPLHRDYLNKVEAAAIALLHRAIDTHPAAGAPAVHPQQHGHCNG
jgi:hypothetical protein